MPFKSGQSGNPKGRPLAGAALSEAYRRLLEMPIEELLQYKPRLVKEGIARNVILMAQRDEAPLNYIREITDRTEGRPEQRQVHVGDNDSPPIRITLKNGTSEYRLDGEADGSVEAPGGTDQ